MKKTIISLVTVASLALAGEYSYDLTIGGGINHFADSINMEDDEAFGHISLQYNDFLIKPQLAYEHIFNAKYEGLNKETKVDRVFLNGVYEFTDSGFVPYMLVGLGVESIDDYQKHRFTDHATLINGGLGFKFNIGRLDLKLEGRYMKRWYAGGTEGHEMVALAGITIPFGKKVAPAPTPAPVPEPTPEPVVEEKPVAAPTPAPKPEPTPPADSDNDGVVDTIDKCPNTAPNAKVDEFGCAEVFKLNDLRFKTGSAKINTRYVADLNKLVKYLKENPLYSVEIAGHTDSRGSARFNKRLSQRRANAVKNYLISHGIEASRIRAVGYGEEQPIASNKTAEGRRMNRRVEAHIFVAN